MNKKTLFFTATLLLLSPISFMTYGNQDIHQKSMANEQQVAVEFFVLSVNIEEANNLTLAVSLDTPNIKSLLDKLVPVDITEPISLGDQFDIPALVKELEGLNVAQVVANPYLITSNNIKASVTIGETRRIVTSQTQDFATIGDKSANCSIEVTPTIISDGIRLNLNLMAERFINSSETMQHTINTKIHFRDKEVLFLKLPFEDESIGYKENLFIFISSSIINK